MATLQTPPAGHAPAVSETLPGSLALQSASCTSLRTSCPRRSTRTADRDSGPRAPRRLPALAGLSAGGERGGAARDQRTADALGRRALRAEEAVAGVLIVLSGPNWSE